MGMDDSVERMGSEHGIGSAHAHFRRGGHGDLCGLVQITSATEGHRVVSTDPHLILPRVPLVGSTYHRYCAHALPMRMVSYHFTPPIGQRGPPGTATSSSGRATWTLSYFWRWSAAWNEHGGAVFDWMIRHPAALASQAQSRPCMTRTIPRLCSASGRRSFLTNLRLPFPICRLCSDRTVMIRNL